MGEPLGREARPQRVPPEQARDELGIAGAALDHLGDGAVAESSRLQGRPVPGDGAERGAAVSCALTAADSSSRIVVSSWPARALGARLGPASTYGQRLSNCSTTSWPF